VSLLIFTSLASIGSGSGLGYRIALGLAVIFTLVGAFILTRYNEKKVLEILEVK
jgi:hypothetical protein